ncbi:MAG: hypothetical protein CVU47_10640 [Chloroflexi bacterium HGW-Chloroflexi-9]|nr:MAG: hypothetical protein CVU47_10640 [Chloroflexi bacterium HGW-Chloroflexi-9]
MSTFPSESSNGSTPVLLIGIESADEALEMLPLISAFASGGPFEVVFLEVRRAQAMAEARPEGAFTEVLERLQREGVTARLETREGQNFAGVLREAAGDLRPALLLAEWEPETGSGPGRRITLTDRRRLEDLLIEVPVDLAMLGHIGVLRPPRRVLMVTTGEGDVTLAHDIGARITAGNGGHLTLLGVSRSGKAEGANGMIESLHALAAAAPDPSAVSVRVAEARTLAAAALQNADPNEYDLMIVTSPTGGVLHRTALSDLAERIIQQATLPVLVVKRRPAATATALRRLTEAVRAHLPRMTEAQKVATYRELRRGSRGTVDFFVMIALAAAIAGLGLLLSSPAVVIGGMLVAPLMTPVLGLGLSLALGDSRLLRLSLASTVRGACLAVLIGAGSALLVPGVDITPEVLGRTHPSLLDLGVAVAAGFAAAYAVGRPSVSSSLPGVAVAVALVPPLAVIGIALAGGRHDLARGALLLFGANFTAIAATSGLMFIAFGFFPEPEHAPRLRVFGRGFLALSVLVVAISVPLAGLTLRSISDASFTRSVESALDAEFGGAAGMRWREYESEGERAVLRLTVDVEATRPLERVEIAQIQERLTARLERPVSLVVRVVQVTEVSTEAEEEAEAEATPTEQAQPTP